MVAIGFVLVVLAVACGPAPASAVDTAATSPAPAWKARYNGPGNQNDAAWSVAVSPDGTKSIVTGYSYGGVTSGIDYATVAYDTATGAKLWAARYNGPGSAQDSMDAAGAFTPDGTKVIVTGGSMGVTSSDDYATIAYDTSTGAKLWAARYNGPGDDHDEANSVAVSPDGTTAVVTGSSAGKSSRDYATVAYDTATGKRKWVARYNGPSDSDETAKDVTITPDGTKVVVTGESPGQSDYDYATVAYDTATGERKWVARYNGPAKGSDSALMVAVNPAGTRVIVTGTSRGGTSGDDYATVAYDAATGARMWVARYNGAGNGFEYGSALAVTPDGGKVVVTGASPGATSGNDYLTIAYDIATGTKAWATRYNGPANGSDSASAVAVTPDGGKVLVTGASAGTTSGADYLTIAYDAATGAKAWATRYNGPANGHDTATGLAVTPDNSEVVVTGLSSGKTSLTDYGTIAYPI